jgi:hypothetical protein
MESKIKLPMLKGIFFGDIDAFNDIKFEDLETNNIRKNIQTKIDFDDWFLYVIGSDKFMENSFPSFDVSFMNTKTKKRISPNAFLDFNDEGIKKLREGWGVELVRGDVLKNVSEESIMDIINSVKKNTSKMDLYNVIIKNEVGDEIKSVKDLEFLGSDISFFFFNTPLSTSPYQIKVFEEFGQYVIGGLTTSGKRLSLDFFELTLKIDGLSKTQLFESMQQIANRTFIENVLDSWDSNIEYLRGATSVTDLQVNGKVTDWLDLNDDEKKAIGMLSKIQFLNKNPFENFDEIDTNISWGLAKFPQEFQKKIGDTNLVLFDARSTLKQPPRYSTLIKNAPESLTDDNSTILSFSSKQRATASIKEISDDLLKIAMMPKEYRVSSILNLKMLVDDLDEDDVPKEQVDLLKSIVDDLIDEVKYPTNQETNKEAEAEAVQEEAEAEEQVDLEADICALNDLLDDAFDVDNVDDLLGLLDCEIGEEDMSYAEQKIYQKEKNLILDYKMDLGYSTYPFTINETIYKQNEVESRDIVDEETGFVIPIRLDATTKMLYPFDSEQLQRWEKWGLV